MSKLITNENQAESLNNNQQEFVEEETIKTIWNQEELTKLLGYSDSDSEITSPQKQNIIPQSELFDNPRDQKTKHKFSNHPFSKVGTVAFAMFVLCALTGIIMKGMTSGGPTKAPSIHATAPPSSKPEIEDHSPTPDKLENGRLKASLALDDQVRAVKAVEDSKKNQSKIKFDEKSSKAHTQKLTNISQVTPKKSSSQIVYRPPKRNLPSPNYRPIPQKIPQPQIKQENDNDPIAELQTINRLGSYGSETIPQPSEENFKVDPQITLQNHQIIEVNKPSGQVTPSQQTQFLPEEEKIINGTKNKTHFRVGSIILGKLVSPLVWVEQNNTQPQKIVIVTTKPVIKNNQIILPKNTEIIATITNVQSGVVRLQATQLIFDDREYSIPPGVIAINADKGKPLIASKWKNKNKQTARDAEIFLLGSLAQVGKVLNQPHSQQFSTHSGLTTGNITFSSTQRGRGSMLGSILSGGFSPLTQQILQRNKETLQQKINSESKVWFLKADTKIEMFVNQSFSIN